MKIPKLIQTFLACSIALASSFGISSAQVDDGNKPIKPLESLSPVVNELNPVFGSDIYRKHRATEGNVFFSPYSISEAMGMAYAGSGGNTSTESAKALSFTQDTKRHDLKI